MAHFKPHSYKSSDDDAKVTLYRDAAGAWFVGCDQDPGCHPQPVGAFISREAAQRWADRRFPGGSWER